MWLRELLHNIPRTSPTGAERGPQQAMLKDICAPIVVSVLYILRCGFGLYHQSRSFQFSVFVEEFQCRGCVCSLVLLFVSTKSVRYLFRKHTHFVSRMSSTFKSSPREGNVFLFLVVASTQEMYFHVLCVPEYSCSILYAHSVDKVRATTKGLQSL